MAEQQQKMKVAAANGSKKKVATPTGHHQHQHQRHHVDVKVATEEVDTLSPTGVRHHEAHMSIEVDDVNKCTGEVRRAKTDLFEISDDD